MRPSPRVLIGGVLAAFVAIGGGVLTLSPIHGQTPDNWRSNVYSGSLLNAMQAPAAAVTHVPGATSSPSVGPSSKPSASPSGKPSSKPSAKPTTPVPSASASVINQLLAQINKLRADHGLPPYTLLGGLNASAHKHNIQMMGTCGMSHQCPGEPSLGSRISAQGVHWNACGENIGYSGPHPNTSSALVAAAEGLTTAMYNETPPDDGHRRNLLSTQFHHVGIDVVRDSSGRVWLTQDFSN